ncbi:MULTISPECIES: Uma2 family endonuclease [unclassified Nostoc]|uniref:Uma2 family endonuclease n=1 Tax=unclassified Nostoc TaxID=2593658 RepID=UPI002AD38054|nr:Uma2 family endonuclease [Nostoc sp. DedQUE03]MDZ7973087.1 Uma2 family endonuclease [Nostoc sp. DedQUE03]MDZ8042946.1 Uma2 family endonuclease [Nostoc sp. DedQUE02]
MVQLLSKATDQRIVRYDGTWEQFKLIQKGFEGYDGVRLFYYNGTIEILTPGEDHEFFKTIIGFLIELFLIEKGIEFIPAGSMTQERQGTASAQADESYWFGQKQLVPDISIEVVFSSGGSNKLERYKALGVPEVWFWEDGFFSLYHLQEQNYERIYRSQLPGLTDLDIDLLSRCVLIAQTSRIEAVREFRQVILRKEQS